MLPTRRMVQTPRKHQVKTRLIEHRPFRNNGEGDKRQAIVSPSVPFMDHCHAHDDHHDGRWEVFQYIDGHLDDIIVPCGKC